MTKERKEKRVNMEPVWMASEIGGFVYVGKNELVIKMWGEEETIRVNTKELMEHLLGQSAKDGVFPVVNTNGAKYKLVVSVETDKEDGAKLAKFLYEREGVLFDYMDFFWWDLVQALEVIEPAVL